MWKWPFCLFSLLLFGRDSVINIFSLKDVSINQLKNELMTKVFVQKLR